MMVEKAMGATGNHKPMLLRAMLYFQEYRDILSDKMAKSLKK
ncbi:hypothetical protein [uncultured Cohaesibacter sp.]|nr:hypothetical protein [uncultured Cohaesibacter sp.]